MPYQTIRQKLERMPWVEEVKQVKDKFVLKTKPDVLKFTLTETIFGSDNFGWNSGGLLPQPITLSLPQYYVHINKSFFSFQLVNEPKARAKYFGITPQFHAKVGSKYEIYFPCFGNANGNSDGVSTLTYYQRSKDWAERARIAVEFVQSAVPHYTKHWYRTYFAHQLGLVGDEVRSDISQAQTDEVTPPVPEEEIVVEWDANE